MEIATTEATLGENCPPCQCVQPEVQSAFEGASLALALFGGAVCVLLAIARWKPEWIAGLINTICCCRRQVVTITHVERFTDFAERLRGASPRLAETSSLRPPSPLYVYPRRFSPSEEPDVFLGPDDDAIWNQIAIPPAPASLPPPPIPPRPSSFRMIPSNVNDGILLFEMENMAELHPPLTGRALPEIQRGNSLRPRQKLQAF
nr:hypothetical protein [Nitrosomonas nitrosa]